MSESTPTPPTTVLVMAPDGQTAVSVDDVTIGSQWESPGGPRHWVYTVIAIDNGMVWLKDRSYHTVSVQYLLKNYRLVPPKPTTMSADNTTQQLNIQIPPYPTGPRRPSVEDEFTLWAKSTIKVLKDLSRLDTAHTGHWEGIQLALTKYKELHS